LSFESSLLQATFISYRIELILSRSFFFLFSRSFGLRTKSLPLKASGLLFRPYRSATCTILQDSGRVVNSFFEKK
ncbi:processing of HyaA and HyaB protein, partial [Mitsuokella jalaludinii]|uniref:processing of HyaA and HyaB protein n=1 Tax=Mitsuokella jalaludinii TaxID=187979 RepID=UPI003D0358D1